MNKVKKITLDNGLRIFLFKDNKKNRTYASVNIFAGGRDTHFIYDGKEYNQVEGIAHCLEHYLIENSKYGNITEYFSNEYIDSNGVTNRDITKYYISTVHDFEDNFIKLLNYVNDPVFDKDSLEDIKKPILSEIQREDDNPNKKYGRYVMSCIYNTLSKNETLGTKKDIEELSIDDIELFHKAFYRPSNQAIIISGKIDEDRIIKIIKDEYKKFKIDTKEVIQDEVHEDIKLPVKNGEFVDKDKDECVDIIYKLDLSSFTPEEKYCLRFYLKSIIYLNFSERTPLFEKLRKSGISIYSVSRDYDVTSDNDIAVLSFCVTTTRHDEAVKLIEDTLNNLEYNEKYFKTEKNNALVNCINLLESVQSFSDVYLTSLFEYDYEIKDLLELTNKYNLKECKELIGRLDFSNKCIIKRIKGE